MSSAAFAKPDVNFADYRITYEKRAGGALFYVYICIYYIYYASMMRRISALRRARVRRSTRLI